MGRPAGVTASAVVAIIGSAMLLFTGAVMGVAMGAAGTDVAMETADVALMGDDLSKLPYALHLAHRTKRVVRQNLALSMIVIAGLVIGSLSGGFTLPIAVIGHELSELAVIVSGLRLLKA